jgi:hypothetical protein
MQILTNKQINRQDFVDNAVFDMIKLLNPSRNKMKWNIEFIAYVRDSMEALFVKRMWICDKQKFYPSIKIK